MILREGKMQKHNMKFSFKMILRERKRHKHNTHMDYKIILRESKRHMHDTHTSSNLILRIKTYIGTTLVWNERASNRNRYAFASKSRHWYAMNHFYTDRASQMKTLTLLQLIQVRKDRDKQQAHFFRFAYRYTPKAGQKREGPDTPQSHCPQLRDTLKKTQTRKKPVRANQDMCLLQARFL